MNFALGLGHDRSGDRHGNNPSSLKVDDHPNRYMDRKAVIKSCDMPKNMESDAIDFAIEGLEKYKIEKDIAVHIRKNMEQKFNPTWHVFVGRNLGAYVTHEAKTFLYFYMGQFAIMMFKTEHL